MPSSFGLLGWVVATRSCISVVFLLKATLQVLEFGFLSPRKDFEPAALGQNLTAFEMQDLAGSASAAPLRQAHF